MSTGQSETEPGFTPFSSRRRCRFGPAPWRRATLLIVCLLAGAIVGEPLAQRRSPVRPSKPTHRHLSSGLSALTDVAAVSGAAAAEQAAARSNGLVRGGRIPVTIRAGDDRRVDAMLRAHGILPANRIEGVIEAYVPFGLLSRLARVPSVSRITPIVRPRPQVVSEGVAGHNVPAWTVDGYTGAGVKVGIIDLGFIGFGGLMGAEVPGAVSARCYTGVGTFTSSLEDCATYTNHGTAAAETIHDIAPDAELVIANPLSHLDLRATVSWMAAQGVRVINFSLSTPWDGPGDGTSPDPDSPLATIDQAVASGVTFVTVAGNYATSTWFGTFADGNGNGSHEFDGFELNALHLNANDHILLEGRWADSWTAASTDLDFYLYDSAFNVVAASLDYQSGLAGHRPFESISHVATTSGTYYLEVYRYAGAPPAWIQVQARTQQPLSVSRAAGSIASPAETKNPGALGVGAAPWSSTFIIEAFSSRGPTPDGRIKPDITGLDRGSSFTYGPTGFWGTSQATAHISGLAALVQQVFPTYRPVDVTTYLKRFARPRGAAIPNNTWGAGLARLPSATASAPFGAFDTPLAGSIVAGEVGATGWALDDGGVTGVRVYRDPVSGEPTSPNGLVFIGDAVFVPGARPDVQAAYASYPASDRAGWGLMILTNMLPNQGNGGFTLYAFALDRDGHSTLLGSRTVTGANATSVKPFGTIDVPAQGQTVSGVFVNFAWGLTPLPNTIPFDGSTIDVYIDGGLVGHPVYNNFRADIAGLFPGLNNSNGAVGYRIIDTTSMSNGLHSIAWVLRDDAGNTKGIGSRYFTVQNP
jgi:hypothetical protein